MGVVGGEELRAERRKLEANQLIARWMSCSALWSAGRHHALENLAWGKSAWKPLGSLSPCGSKLRAVGCCSLQGLSGRSRG